MENKIIRAEHLEGELIADYHNNQTIEFYKEMVNNFEKLGATHIKVYADNWDGVTEAIQYEPIKQYYETNEQVKIRLDKEVENQRLYEQIKEENEKSLLESLKLKYEPWNLKSNT